MASVQRAIKIYSRIKPVSGEPTPYQINKSTRTDDEEILTVTALKNSYDEYHVVNNKPELYNFRYTRAFDASVNQDQIFNEVACPVIDSALLGYNGTIFAYGQTGSGKTHTMTGSRLIYDDRGIIPRTLQYIFEKFNAVQDGSKIHALFVSYLEIYNEVGYDLLHSADLESVDDFPKVTIQEDSHQQMHLKNLSVHPIDCVAEATQMLYLGEHNRTVAETPFNEASTRSHCIFTIHLNIRDSISSVVKRSKVHLVDLAGSERVANSNVTGQLLNEARHINLALHYLEQVIVALGETGRQHIPYRNSMMTSLLRDSLGGNCLTAMIATLSMDSKNLQETLSTNRFAQRVALVTNAAIMNEELDANVVISQLKTEVRKLKETIVNSAVKPIVGTIVPLTEEEEESCEALVNQFLLDTDKDAILPISPDMRLIQQCFRLLKSKAGLTRSNTQMSKIYGNTKLADDKSMAQLVARREAEIKVLMSMLRKEKTKNHSTASAENLLALNCESGENIPSTERSLGHITDGASTSENDFEEIKSNVKPVRKPIARESQHTKLSSKGSVYSLEDESFIKGLTGQKKEAIGNFMKTYPGTQTLNKVRTNLMQKRTEIRTLEATIESQHTNMESLKGLMATATDPDKIQEAYKSQQRTCQMQEERLQKSIQSITELEAALKTHFRFLLDDFEIWWNNNHKASSHEIPSFDSNNNLMVAGEPSLFKNIDFVLLGNESQVETKKPIPSTYAPRKYLKHPEETFSRFDKMISRDLNSDNQQKLGTYSMYSNLTDSSGTGRDSKLNQPAQNIKISDNSSNDANSSSNSNSWTRSNQNTNISPRNNVESVELTPPVSKTNRTLPKIMSPTSSRMVQAKTPEHPNQVRFPGIITIPNKELYYVPGEIRPAPRAPPVSPINPNPRKVKRIEDSMIDNGQTNTEEWYQNLPLTGEHETDSEILKFFRIRKQISQTNIAGSNAK